MVRALAATGAAGPFSIRLHKRIPIGGGLGGGSSDAAAILRAAAAGALGQVPAARLARRRAGARLRRPFFLSGTGALVEGTGERVTPLGPLPPWWTVVLRPPVGVATAEAYRLLDAARERSPSRPRATSASLEAVDALQRGDFDGLEATLQNDFETPITAANPSIGAALQDLGSAGAIRPMLSGSGSCVFALFRHEDEARACAARLSPNDAAEHFVAPFHRDPGWR